MATARRSQDVEPRAFAATLTAATADPKDPATTETREATFSELRFMRLGALLLLAFLTAYALRPAPAGVVNLHLALGLHLSSILAGLILVALTYSRWMPRHWRPIELASCTAAILTLLGVALADRESEPLSLVIMGIMISDGAVLPWGVRWQAALSSVGLAVFALFAILAPAGAAVTSIQWISIVAAAAIGQTFSALATNHRRELREQMLALRETQTRLEGEIAERERALRARERTERELIAAREAALAASRAKSEFLSSMSHEIRTPLNALLGMADLLAETPLAPEQARFVDTVVNNGNALLELINSILDLARIESGRLSLEKIPFDLRDTVRKCAETLAVRAREKQLALTVLFSPGLRTDLIGDSLRLRQILINLIGNAIKFTEHGEVRITAEPDPNSIDPGCIRFSVADTGIGIAADKVPSLFTAFTQADSSTTRKYGGSGLGLAIVQRLVALMKGRVAVESEPGHGSIFSFTARFDVQQEIPVYSSEKIAALPPNEENLILDRHLCILLADDSPDNRLLVRSYLKNTPYTVDEAENGKVAIEKFMTSSYDLVLMDIQMPEVDGCEATRAMRRWEREHGHPHTPILAVTAAALEENRRQTREAGCDMHVTKPVKRATLLRAISDAVTRAGTTGREPLVQVA